jgi:hypothetical protein
MPAAAQPARGATAFRAAERRGRRRTGRSRLPGPIMGEHVTVMTLTRQKPELARDLLVVGGGAAGLAPRR